MQKAAKLLASQGRCYPAKSMCGSRRELKPRLYLDGCCRLGQGCGSRTELKLWIFQVDAAGLKEDVEAEKGSDDLDEKGKQRCVIQEALGLFNLMAHRLLFEPLTDTKAVVAWSDTTILVSFRGTASMKAAKLDLKVRHVCDEDPCLAGLVSCASPANIPKARS